MKKAYGKKRFCRGGKLMAGILFFLFTALPVHSAAADSQRTGNEKPAISREVAGSPFSADLVWAQSDGHDYQIFVSFFDGRKWSAPFQITDDPANDIVPAVVRDKSGTLWVVWTRAAGGVRELYFRTFDGRKWSEEKKIETGFTVNLSAALAVDRSNQVWLVWSSFDGVDDDIFFSRWNGAGWSVAMRVNTDDATPDIQPVIGLGDDGQPWVRWSGFENGDYHRFESRWNGTDWEQETRLPESAESDSDQAEAAAQPESLVNTRPTEIEAGAPDGQSRVIPLPDFVGDPWKAGICIESGGRVTSQPLRTLLNAKEAKQN
jgi:hypothetical protein